MLISIYFFFFNDTATTEIYTLSLHDALPIWLAYDGTHPDVHALGSADLESLRLLDNLIQHLVVDLGVQDSSGGRATLLACVAVGADYYVLCCGVEVG